MDLGSWEKGLGGPATHTGRLSTCPLFLSFSLFYTFAFVFAVMPCTPLFRSLPCPLPFAFAAWRGAAAQNIACFARGAVRIKQRHSGRRGGEEEKGTGAGRFDVDLPMILQTPLLAVLLLFALHYRARGDIIASVITILLFSLCILPYMPTSCNITRRCALTLKIRLLALGSWVNAARTVLSRWRGAAPARRAAALLNVLPGIPYTRAPRPCLLYNAPYGARVCRRYAGARAAAARNKTCLGSAAAACCAPASS